MLRSGISRLVFCAFASLWPPLAAQAALVQDSLIERLGFSDTSGYPMSGVTATSTPQGDSLVLVLRHAVPYDFTPQILGEISDAGGAQVGGLRIAFPPVGLIGPQVSFGAAGSSNGKFLVAWTATEGGPGNHVVARFFDRQGAAGDEEVLTGPSTTEERLAPVVVCNGVARCVVSWIARNVTTQELAIEGRVLDSLSHPDQESFRVPLPGGSGGAHALALASAGHFAVLAPGRPPTVSLFAGTGAPLAAGLPLDGPSPSAPDVPQVAAVGAFDEAGNLMAVFPWRAEAGNEPILYSRRFSPTGQAVGEIVQVNETSQPGPPAIAWNRDAGHFTVVWIGGGTRVLARAFDAGGEPASAELLVKDNTAQEPLVLQRADLAPTTSSRLAIVWSRAGTSFPTNTEVYRRFYRLGAGSCDQEAEGEGRPRCVQFGPEGRFQVTSAFRADNGRSAPATLEALTANAAFLFFRGEENPEVVTKILDGRPINGSFWYFSGAMSNQEYEVTAFDTETGRVASYYNPPNTLRSLADTSTFVDLPLANADAAEPVSSELLSLGSPERGVPDARPSLFTASVKAANGVGCLIPTPTSLCLNEARFRVEVRWTDFAGNTGQATAVQTTADGGYFWFFNPNNVELALKILDGRPVNGKFWVFYASLSNVRFVVRIYDESGSLVKVYRNPPRTLASVADTQAF